MSISFNQIPVTLRIPGVYVETEPKPRGPLDFSQNILLIGQMLSTATAAAETPVLVFSAAQAESLFGQGSMLARMYRFAHLNNDYTPIWCLPLADNAAGAAAAGSITITGAAAANGTLNIYLGGDRVQVGVYADDAAADVATALAAAINADASLCVSAAASAGVVTLTAKHKGELGNHVSVMHSYYAQESLPAGINVAVAAMTGGSGNPDISSGLAALAEAPYDYFVLPYTDTASLNAMRDELEGRWSYSQQTYGLAWSAAKGTAAELVTLGVARNDPYTSIMGAGKSPNNPEDWAAAYGARAAFYLNMDPARPLQTITLKGLLPPVQADRFVLSERDLHLHSGISTYMVPDGQCRIECAISTYQQNAFGAPDNNQLYMNILAINQRLAQGWIAWVTTKYSRHKLGSDGAVPPVGQAWVTPSIMRGEGYEYLMQQHIDPGIVEHPDNYKDEIIAEIDDSEPTQLNMILPAYQTKQLRKTYTKIAYS